VPPGVTVMTPNAELVYKKHKPPKDPGKAKGK
jgi:hypothetical protein